MTAPVTDHRSLPLGVMPRQLQRWVLLGTAAVMIGIMAFSGNPSAPRSAATMPPPTPGAVDPNQQRIEEYQRRIQEQAQRLAAEQAELHVAKEALGGPAPAPSMATSPTSGAAVADKSLFVDSVAFSRGTHASTASPEPPTQVLTDTPAPKPTSGKPTYRIPEGSIIETVLTNRLDGTFAGPVNCLVTTSVYAPDRQHLLIPAGARVLGDARAVNAFGQSRLAVVFHRVLLPNGERVDLEAFQGLNQIGETGLRDQVDRHYAQIFGASLAVGAIAGLAQAQTGVGLDATSLDTYRQGTASSLAQSSARILDRFLNLLPTVTIREGHRIKVYLLNDLDLPAYREALATTGGHP